MAGSVTITGIEGIPEVQAGDDLGRLIFEAAQRQGIAFADDDLVIVTQKVVSKSEGRFVDLADVEPSPLAQELAANWEKDPRHVEVVLRETKRIVRMDHGVVICETRHGFVCANAGVDASNVPGNDRLLLLPEDPDASARRIRKALMSASGADVAVIISDTFGRPWRTGYTEVAIGVAGMLPIVDYVGVQDTAGRELRVTWICVADELASAAELVTGKVNQIPATLIRGYQAPKGEGSAYEVVRQAETDMFR
ncbi:MAG TPA: coenzyme F420-0:L-glutamate ligase [Dehalococcoidia bacterium]|jgi:coenzyme F420-0:L-glutamate ligase/coenzyme F420-1:gamma-L-glutamate ligase